MATMLDARQNVILGDLELALMDIDEVEPAAALDGPEDKKRLFEEQALPFMDQLYAAGHNGVVAGWSMRCARSRH